MCIRDSVGSLPRSNELSDLLVKREEGQPIDTTQLSRAMDTAVRHVVEMQASSGVDIGNDGEQQRVGFQTYVAQRMTGVAVATTRSFQNFWKSCSSVSPNEAGCRMLQRHKANCVMSGAPYSRKNS